MSSSRMAWTDLAGAGGSWDDDSDILLNGRRIKCMTKNEVDRHPLLSTRPGDV